MKSVTIEILNIVERTRQSFFEIHGKNCKADKKLFINWYFEMFANEPSSTLIHDLSEYYLHISEDRILKYLNEKK